MDRRRNRRDKRRHFLFLYCCCIASVLAVLGIGLGTTLGLGMTRESRFETTTTTQTTSTTTQTTSTTTQTTSTTTTTEVTTTPIIPCESDIIYMTYDNEFNNNSFFLEFDPYANTATTIGPMGHDIDYLFNTPINQLYGIQSNLTGGFPIRTGFALFQIDVMTGAATPICENTQDFVFGFNFPFGVTQDMMLFILGDNIEVNNPLFCVNLITCEGIPVFNITRSTIFGTVFADMLYYAQSSVPNVNNAFYTTPVTVYNETNVGMLTGNFISTNSVQMFPYCPISDGKNETILQLYYQNLFPDPTIKYFRAVDPFNASTTDNGINFPGSTGIDFLFGAAGACWCPNQSV